MGMERLSDVIGVYVSVSYVVAVYLASKNVNDFKIRRNDPNVIKARMKSVTLVTLLNLIMIPLVLKYLNGDEIKNTLLRFGLVPGFLNNPKTGLPEWIPRGYFKDVVSHMKLAAILYTSPLIDSFLHYCFMPDKSWNDMFKDIIYEFSNIWGFRDYIFGPVTEELFYTSMILVCYLRLCHNSTIHDANYLKFVVPNLFGFAHLHHAYEQYTLGMMNLINIVFVTLLQMTYTWLFGSFTNHLFLNSAGNLLSCILIHTFCNFMGLPQGNSFSKSYSILLEGKKSRLGTLASLIWRLLYLPTLIITIVAFKNNFSSLTRSGSFPALI
ncbi:CAAX prenyl protease 2 [Kluyveromyces marxianus]